MNTPRRITYLLSLLSVTLLAACVNAEVKRKNALDKFMQDVAGEWHSDSGADLFLAPVIARMVAYDTMYVERRDPTRTFGRMLELGYSKEGKIQQRAWTFTQEGQWRDLRENPELFTALLPKDVKPAGMCDIQPAADGNTLSYSCGGSPPETFRRRQHD